MACHGCISNCTVVNEPAFGPSYKPDESTPHPRILCSKRPILISSLQMLSSCFMDIVLHEFVIFLMYAACPAYPTLPVLITLIYEEACELLILKYGAFYGFSFSLVVGNPCPTVSVSSFRLKTKESFMWLQRHHL
jgi:hypothetical protein